MCWLATSMHKYSTMNKIETIAELAIFCICTLSTSSVRHYKMHACFQAHSMMLFSNDTIIPLCNWWIVPRDKMSLYRSFVVTLGWRSIQQAAMVPYKYMGYLPLLFEQEHTFLY